MNENQLTETFLTREVVYPGKIIRVERWQVELPNGHQALREVVCHPGASAIVALDENKQVILVRQHRIAVGRLTLEIPAGKLDGPDEDPFVCAQRELSEETGMEADHWQKLTVMDTTPGFCNERIHIYLATGLEQGDCHPDDDEFLAVTRMPLAQAVENVMNGTFRDGKTALGIMMAAAAQGVSTHSNE